MIPVSAADLVMSKEHRSNREEILILLQGRERGSSDMSPFVMGLT